MTEPWIYGWIPECPEYPRNGVGHWEALIPVDVDENDDDGYGDGEWLKDWAEEYATHGDPDDPRRDDLYGVGPNPLDDINPRVVYDQMTDELKWLA